MKTAKKTYYYIYKYMDHFDKYKYIGQTTSFLQAENDIFNLNLLGFKAYYKIIEK